MKTIAIFAFVLCASAVFTAASVLATELKVPQLAPKRVPVESQKLPPVADQVTAYAACMQRITEQCSGTHRTKLFTRACIYRNRYQCRGKA
jgi:hypothetical protein